MGDFKWIFSKKKLGLQLKQNNIYVNRMLVIYFLKSPFWKQTCYHYILHIRLSLVIYSNYFILKHGEKYAQMDIPYVQFLVHNDSLFIKNGQDLLDIKFYNIKERNKLSFFVNMLNYTQND